MTVPQEPRGAKPRRDQASDWYVEDGRVVFTEAYHRRRGHCCGNGCRHCPYEPPHVEGNRRLR